MKNGTPREAKDSSRSRCTVPPVSAENDGLRWDTIPAMTAAAAERFGDLVAIVDGDTTLTFAELYDEARTFESALGIRVRLWNAQPRRREDCVAKWRRYTFLGRD